LSKASGRRITARSGQITSLLAFIVWTANFELFAGLIGAAFAIHQRTVSSATFLRHLRRSFR